MKRKIEPQHALVGQEARNFAVGNALGEALDNGCLAYAGFADQHGLFLVRRQRIWITRSSSPSRPTSGFE